MENVFEFEDSHVSVRTFGRAYEYDKDTGDTRSGVSFIKNVTRGSGLASVVWQRLPSELHFPDRRFKVTEWPNGSTSYVERDCVVPEEMNDGVILTEPNHAVMMGTRDCLVLTIYSVLGGPTAVLHAGRTALQGYNCDQPKASVIRSAFERCWDKTGWDSVRSLRAVLTAGIAPEHFPNDRYPELVCALRHKWGPGVIADPARSTLDMVALVKAQLRFFAGMEDDQIVWDELDTVNDDRLASHRTGDLTTPNAILVVKKT